MTSKDAFDQFEASLRNGRLGHAYVIAAPPKEEGVPLVTRILQLLRCTELQKPCGSCDACRRVSERTDPDFLWIEPQSKSRKILIEEIRAATHQMCHTSYLGQWKSCVLIGADRMVDQAANAFLKTLEEPPPRCVFFLVTGAPEMLLPTIISRCQVVRVAEVDEVLSAWRAKVPEILASEADLMPVNVKPRFTQAFARSELLTVALKKIREEAARKEKAAAKQEEDVDEDVVDARASARYREARTALFRTLAMWYRDLLVLVSGGGETALHFPEHVEWLRRKAGQLSYRAALRNVRTVEEMNRQAESNIPDGIVLGRGFCRLL